MVSETPQEPVSSANESNLMALATDFQLSTELEICLREAHTTVQLMTQGKRVLEIRSHEVESEARRLFNHYKEYLSQIEAERCASKEPIIRAGRLIDSKAKVHSAAASEAKGLLEYALLEWMSHQLVVSQRVQSKIDAEHQRRVAAANKVAEKKGIEPKPVMAAALVQVPTKSTTVVTASGKTVTQTWVDRWRWRILGIVDPSQLTADKAEAYGIPLSRFKLDCSAIDKVVTVLKTADPFPGSKIEGYNDGYLR